TIYSVLKKTLNVKQNVDIAKFLKFVPYLKNKCIDYRPKKSKVLTKTEIEKFVQEALEKKFLLMKIILIMGIYGACRRVELLKLTINDIEEKSSAVIVKIQNSKTHSQRTFVISNPIHIQLCRKYYILRSAYITNLRLFNKYVNGKCVN
ncbi:Phage integrase domain containing protein, partial [Asbolus verrucosus]